MSRRRVEVELILEAGNYLSEARAVAAETKAAGRSIDGMGDQADGASTDMKQLAANADVAAHEVDKLGDQARQTAVDMELLDRRIAATKRSVAALGIEFAATGNMKTGTRFQRERGVLGQLEALKDELTGGGDSGSFLGDVEHLARTAGQRGGKVFGDSFSGAIDFGGKGIRPMHYLIGALIEALVLALPAIGAMLAGVTAGAIGTAGLAAGIFAASKDPLVKSAFKDFGDHVSAEFFSWGPAFVDPIRESLGILQVDFDRLNLGDSIAKVAPLMSTIASGVGDLALKMMPGLNKALERMEPFATAAAEGFGRVGNALGGFLDDVTRSHGAIEGLRFFFSLLSGTIAFLGASLRWLSERFHDMNKAAAWSLETLSKVSAFANWAKGNGWGGDQADWLGGLSHSINEFANHDAPLAEEWADLLGDSFGETAKRADELAQAIKDVNDAQTNFINAASELDKANTAVGKGFLDLKKEIKDNGKHWNDNTQEAYANQAAIQSQIDLIEQQREAYIKKNGETAEAIETADKKYNDQLQLILAIAAAAGATADQLKTMAGTYTIDIQTVRREVIYPAAMANKTDKSLAISGARAGGGPVGPGSWIVGDGGQAEVLTLGPGQYGTVTPSVGQWQAGQGSAAPIVVRNEITLLDPMTGQRTRAILISESTNRGVPSATAAAAYP